jgi:hypothetical protein
VNRVPVVKPAYRAAMANKADEDQMVREADLVQADLLVPQENLASVVQSAGQGLVVKEDHPGRLDQRVHLENRV